MQITQKYTERTVSATSLEMPAAWNEDLIRCLPTALSPVELTLRPSSQALGDRQTWRHAGEEGLVYLNVAVGDTLNGDANTRTLEPGESVTLQATTHGWEQI